MRSIYKRDGFTLIELIFVIVVIGILASFALPRFNNTRQKAISSTIKQDVSTITRAIKNSYMLNKDISDISSIVEFDPNVWSIDSTNLKLEYKISQQVCISIEVDKSSSTKLKVNINPSSTSQCQLIANDGVVNSEEELY